jgi:hypothetical protein
MLAAALSPPPAAPCLNCSQHSGTLSETHHLNVQPVGTDYFSPVGMHNGWLTGPEQANFDLYLLQ